METDCNVKKEKGAKNKKWNDEIRKQNGTGSVTDKKRNCEIRDNER